MDFSKYDPLQKQTKESPSYHPAKDLERGFTAADYDDHSQAPGRHAAWMASTSVILLIEYLRKYPDQGLVLYEEDGIPGLRFDPGIRAVLPMSDRAKIGMTATRLLQDAGPDLLTMIANGIEIPLLIHHQPKAKVQ